MRKYIEKHKTFLEGYSYLYGIPFINYCGYEKNYEKSHIKFNQSIVDGDILGYYGLAVLSQFSDASIVNYTYEKALNHIVHYDDQNDPIYNLIMAQCYEFGDGIDKNTQKSLDCYNKSISQGCIFGNYFLGRAYLGDNFQKDIKIAEKNLNFCIKKEFYPAFEYLTILYSNEIHDYKMAKHFALKSIESGNTLSILDFGKLLVGKGTPTPSPKELELGNEYFAKYIKSNPDDLYAQFVYSILLIKFGDSEPQKVIKGYILLKKLADNGLQDAIKFYDNIKDSVKGFSDELFQTTNEINSYFEELGINISENNFTEQKINKIISEVNNVFDDYDGYKFENMCFRIFKNMGYQVTDTPYSGDGGIDLILIKQDDFIKQKIIVQCKFWNHPVGVPIIRDLYGTLMDCNADKAIVVTNNDFTSQAITFSINKPIELINGTKLQQLKKKYLFKDINNV